MASNMHNSRLMRFLIALIIVVLTIFIYTSYSSTQSLAPPPMRSTYSLSNNRTTANELDSSAANYDINKIPNGNANEAAHKTFRYQANLPHVSLGGSNGNEVVIIKKLVHHRVPTIDVNAIDDDGGGGGGGGGGVAVNGNDAGLEGQGVDDRSSANAGGEDNAVDEMALERFNNNNNDLLQEEQYVQAVDNTLGSINNSVTSVANNGINGLTSSDTNPQLQQNKQQSQQMTYEQQQDQQFNVDSSNNNNNLNKIPESDVLIPTSNLQKFIESADKILKNITVQQQQQTPSWVAPGGNVNKSSDKEQTPLTAPSENKNLDEDNKNGEALPPSSVIMTISGVGSEQAAEKPNEKTKPSSPADAASPNAPKMTSTTKKVPKTATDPTQGIPTKQIYEPGHMNEEIDINQICPNKGEKLKLLILITSAQTHAEARLAIRQTWGHYGTRRDVSTAFILGRTTNAVISTTLTQENMIYGDLIRGHFIDSYNNLTLKTLSALEWVDKNCPKAKYILKTDDDMFINVPKLLKFFDAHAKDKRVIYGRLAKKWKPIRNKKSKYYISTGQFSAAVFPPFTTGPAYVMTSDIVHDLYVNSLEQLYLKLEDVFTTGIVAQKLGVKRVHDNMFLNRRIAFNPCNIRKAISVHMIKPNEQFDLWKKLLDQTTKCK